MSAALAGSDDRRRDHDDHLAARFRAARVVGGERGEIAAPDFLVQLGELARDRGFARPEPGREIGERLGKARPAFEQHEGGGDARQLGNPRAPCGFLGGQEALEEEPVGRQSRHGQRHQRRGGAGRGAHRMPGRNGFAHQPVARIGDQRRAGIGDEGDGLTGREPLQDFRPHRFGIVVVIGDERRRQAVVVEQLAGHARVLAGDEVGRGQNLQRPQGDVAQVPDRGRDRVEPAGQARRLEDVAADRIAAGTVVFG